MNRERAAAAAAALYCPSRGELLGLLPSVATELNRQLYGLGPGSTVEEIDQVIRTAAGLTPFLLRLRMAAEREAGLGGFVA